jgi:hypothetical protein
MKTVFLLYSLLFFLLVAPFASANETEITESGLETLSRAGNSQQLARVMLVQKSKKRKPEKDSGFRDTDPVPGNPHPIGKDKIVTGIVISSVGGGIGVGLISYSIFNYCAFYSYGLDEEEANAKETECRKNNQIMLISGIASTALGLGIGLPKLFEGMKERRVWKQWNRDNAKRKNRVMESRTEYQYKLFLAPQIESKTLAFGLSFDY